MNMKILKITNPKLNEHYFKIDNELNLPILLYPTPQFFSTSAAFATNFGSTTTLFKQQHETEFTQIVDGTAHYLEHKLFEDQGDSNTFKLFAKTGANANAQTSRNSTSYFFSCTQNFEDSLKILLNFVQNPQFNEQSIEKERGIIEQEIQMIEDDPMERVFDGCLSALYHNHPAGKKIGGTIESIAKINSNLLTKCYNAFYSLNNMMILVAGNFDVNSTIETIEKNLKIPTNQPKIELKIFDEPSTVREKFVKYEMAIMLPYFCFGYKITPPDTNLILKQKLIFEIICEILTGEGSNLQKTLYEKNLVSGGMLTYSIEAGKGYFAMIFAGLSTNYEEVFKLLNNEIEQTKKYGFDSKLFDLVKKATFGEQISNFNSVETLQELMLDCFDSQSYNLFEPIETLSNLTLNEIEDNVQLIDTQNSSVAVCFPKNKT